MRITTPRLLRKAALAVVAAVVTVSLVSGCAATSAFGEEISRAFKGVPATMTTYDQAGQKIDEVHGSSFRVARDTRFDTTDTNTDGTVSTVPGEVLLISIGDKHISHVGSSMILAQDGVEPIANASQLVKGENTQAGTPVLNDFRERFRNLWKGRAKTILIRSQDGKPIGVYAGNEVEILPTDVPKSTWFRVDGKYLWAYRVDYTVYDTDLLDSFSSKNL